MRGMTRATRNNDWGFPRWRGYGSASSATQVRLCDRHGCAAPGTCPAPKAPNSPYLRAFCIPPPAEYNRGWDYFAGLSAEEAARREADETRDASGYREAKHYGWGAPGDGTRSRDEMRALEVLELEPDATFDDIRAAWRRLVKANHPDLRPGDAAAAERFRATQAAYDVLRAAEEARAG